MITVELIPILSDNYAYLLSADNEQHAIVDPGEAAPIIDYLSNKGISLQEIWNTHHHWDHINGNEEISRHYGGLPIFNTDKPPCEFGDEPVEIITTPGHTLDHICFYFAESNTLLSGDTLFSMGCGRLFEGSAEQMFTSLQKLKALPNETRIYCGHEYTQSNGEFCLSIEPHNAALQKRMKEVRDLRSKGQPTLPSTIAQERDTNVFLRAQSVEEFAKIRALKDAA